MSGPAVTGSVPGGLAPVVQESTPSLIARSLRQAISRGEFGPGTQLGEAALARELGVSRGPLREAMQRLTQEGLLVSHRNRGLFVPELTAEAVADMYLLRSTVERAALDRLFDRNVAGATADRLDGLVAVMAEHAGRPDSDAMVEADLAFHHELVAAAASPRLSRVHETVMVETAMCLRAMGPTYRAGEDRIAEHRELVAALRAGDRTAAQALLAEHMRDGLARLS